MTKILYLAAVIVLVLAGITAVASCGTSPAEPQTPGIPPANIEVEIADFAYSPATITISIGTTVTWTNKDPALHTVTTYEPLFDSGKLSQNESFSYIFNQRGDFEYHCTFHPHMTGKVIVE